MVVVGGRGFLSFVQAVLPGTASPRPCCPAATPPRLRQPPPRRCLPVCPGARLSSSPSPSICITAAQHRLGNSFLQSGAVFPSRAGRGLACLVQDRPGSPAFHAPVTPRTSGLVRSFQSDGPWTVRVEPPLQYDGGWGVCFCFLQLFLQRSFFPGERKECRMPCRIHI